MRIVLTVDMARHRVRVPALMALSIALVVLAALPVPGEAAKPPRPPVAGERVRLSILDAPPVTGTLLAHRIDALELALAPDSTRRTIARDQIIGLEVARRHGQAGKGALVGLLLGVTVGVVTISAADRHNEFGVGAGALVGSGVLGLALGALVGGAIERDRWEPAPLP